VDTHHDTCAQRSFHFFARPKSGVALFRPFSEAIRFATPSGVLILAGHTGSWPSRKLPVASSVLVACSRLHGTKLDAVRQQVRRARASRSLHFIASPLGHCATVRALLFQ